VLGCAAYLQAEISAGRAGVAVDGNRDAGIAQDVLNVFGVGHRQEEQVQLLVVAVLHGSGPGSVRADCGQRHNVGPVQRFLDPSSQILAYHSHLGSRIGAGGKS